MQTMHRVTRSVFVGVDGLGAIYRSADGAQTWQIGQITSRSVDQRCVADGGRTRELGRLHKPQSIRWLAALRFRPPAQCSPAEVGSPVTTLLLFRSLQKTELSYKDPYPMNIDFAPRTFRGLLVLVASAMLIASAAAQTPAFNIVKPSTTGIPGEEVRYMTFDPAGNLWVLGRFPFWGEGGLAMLSADQLPYEPLPGGGFDTGAWRVWSNVHHPIPSPYLHALAFGTDGTIWIGSDGGLTRFRPNAAPADQWHTYNAANSPLIVDTVISIAIDPQGVLWLSNNSVNGQAGLFRFNPATEQWTHVNPGMRTGTVKLGNNGVVLVSFNNGFLECSGTSCVTRGGGASLGDLVQDPQGNVWGTTSSQGLWKWNGTSWQSWPQLAGTATMNAVGTDRNGVVYVATWHGTVFQMINNTPVFWAEASAIPGEFIGRPNGDIWISNYGGNGVLGTVRHYTAGGQLLERMNGYNAGLGDYFVNRIMTDSAGNMWFAAGETGLTRMLGSNGAADAATRWRNWGNHNDNSEPYPWAGNEPMYCMFEEGNGIFWIGGNGIGRWDSNTGQFTHFWNWQNSNIDTSGVQAIVKRGNTIYAGMGGSGIYWFDGVNWNHTTLSPNGFAYSPNNVKAMAVDTQDNLWVASEFGLRKFAPGNNTNFTLYHQDNSGLPSGSLTDVEADPNGGIWVATFDGLARFDGNTWSSHTQASAGWPGPLVTDFTRRASDGMIAVSTYQGSTWPYTGGVSTFNGTSWTHYTRQNSPLTHWQVEAVQFDNNGHLWASPISEGLVQILIGQQAPALQLTSAASRKTHGSAGTFDIGLPLTGEPAVECRSSGGAHALVFTFSANVTGGTAQVQSGTGSVSGAPIFNGNTMTVNLSGVSDVQTLTVSLSNVTGAGGSVLPAATVTLHLLAGDTNGNKTVNASDIGQTKAESGVPVTAANFRTDVTVNGSITSSDLALVKSRGGQTIGGGSTSEREVVPATAASTR
jgi:ligand-binding sensor domain-containing protein